MMKFICSLILIINILAPVYSQTDTAYFEGKVEYEREREGHIERSTLFIKPGHIALRSIGTDPDGNPGITMTVFSNYFKSGTYYFIKTDWGDTVVERRLCLEPKLDRVVNYGDQVVDTVLGLPLTQMTILYPEEPPYFVEMETVYCLTDQYFIKFPDACFVEIMSLSWRDQRLPLKVIQRYTVPTGAGQERRGEYEVTAVEVKPMSVPDDYFSTAWMMKEAAPYIQK